MVLFLAIPPQHLLTTFPLLPTCLPHRSTSLITSPRCTFIQPFISPCPIRHRSEVTTNIGYPKLLHEAGHVTSRRSVVSLTIEVLVSSFMAAHATEVEETGIPGNDTMLQGMPYTARLGRRSQGDDLQDEILAVKLKVLRAKASAFNVFIDFPDANEQTPITNVHYAGSYFHEPRRIRNPNGGELHEVLFRIGIGDVIQELGLTDCSSVSVTIVPCGADKEFPVQLESLYIEYE